MPDVEELQQQLKQADKNLAEVNSSLRSKYGFNISVQNKEHASLIRQSTDLENKISRLDQTIKATKKDISERSKPKVEPKRPFFLVKTLVMMVIIAVTVSLSPLAAAALCSVGFWLSKALGSRKSLSRFFTATMLTAAALYNLSANPGLATGASIAVGLVACFLSAKFFLDRFNSPKK